MKEITCQTAPHAVKHQGYQITRGLGWVGGVKLLTTSVGGESPEGELGTNSMNAGTLTDQWPVTQFQGSSSV